MTPIQTAALSHHSLSPWQDVPFLTSSPGFVGGVPQQINDVRITHGYCVHMVLEIHVISPPVAAPFA
jgi:hypothetical protein